MAALAVARLALGVVALAVAGLAAEGALTLWFRGKPGGWEVVPEAGSPFVFRPLQTAGDGGAPGAQPARRGDDAPAPTRAAARRGDDAPAPTRAAARRGDDAPDLPRAVRVLSYGDSIAAGYGVDHARAYPALLADALAARGGALPVEIVDLAHGHSPSVYAQHLRHDLPRLSPDAVLVEIELVNDLADEAHVRNAAPADDGLPARIERARYLVGWDGRLLAPLAWRGTWLERTKLWTLAGHAYGRLRSRWHPNPIFAPGSHETYYARAFDRHRLTKADIDAASARLFDVLGAMHDVLEARGVAMTVLVMPSRHAFEAGALRPHGRGLVARAQAQLTTRGIPHVSLLEPLEAAGGDALYLDFCHPTAAGHAVIAHALAEALGDGLLDPALVRPRPRG